MTTNKNRITSPMSLRVCLYVMLVMFASCSSCKKDVDPVSQLPPASQTGANTFGCLIDGKPYIPNGDYGIPSTPPINGGYLGSPTPNDPRHKNRVQLRTYTSDGKRLALYIRNVDKTGVYLLNFNTIPAPSNLYPENNALYDIRGDTPLTSAFYITTSQVVGSVNVTVADTVNKIVAGTFEFEAIDTGTSKKIKITNGRFDINTKTL